MDGIVDESRSGTIDLLCIGFIFHCYGGGVAREETNKSAQSFFLHLFGNPKLFSKK